MCQPNGSKLIFLDAHRVSVGIQKAVRKIVKHGAAGGKARFLNPFLSRSGSSKWTFRERDLLKRLAYSSFNSNLHLVYISFASRLHLICIFIY